MEIFSYLFDPMQSWNMSKRLNLEKPSHLIRAVKIVPTEVTKAFHMSTDSAL